MMNNRIHKRILSAILAIAVLLCGMLVWSAAADNTTLKITADGAEISELAIYPHEKVALTAGGLEGDAEYQWQILHVAKEDVWVDIYDATTDSLSVSAALVTNMLRADGTTQLRCTAAVGGEDYVSAPVTVRIREEVATAPANDVMLLADEDGSAATDSEFVTITIEYWRYDYEKQDDKYVLSTTPTQAFSPYIATIQNGTSFSANVTVPTIVGYEAYLEDGTDVIKNVTLDYASVTTNQVVKVNYKPAQVNYTVRYYFQNIYDDLYVEDAALVKSALSQDSYPVTAEGATGSAPNTTYTEAKFEGFTSMFYQPDTIAADGSTVFEVYYERNYYLMEFDCDGGYGADTVYVRYGTYISVPTPQKSGWSFAGWDLVRSDNENNTTTLNDGVKDTLPTTMPPYNTAYKALWATTETTYTVVYWLQNANPNTDGTYGYSYLSSDVISSYANGDSVRSNDLVSGEMHKTLPTTAEAFQNDSSLINHCVYNATKTAEEEAMRNDLKEGKVVVEGDGSTIVNVYFDRKTYTLKFYYAMTTDTYVYVIGGSTYRFGADATISNKGNEVALLDYYMGSYTSHRGVVSQLPTLNETGVARNYGRGKDESTVNGTAYQYHYIYFSAKYGADISELWPCGVFNSATRTVANTHGKWSGMVTMVSAWNGEHHVEYTQNETLNKGNQTIKGNYERLDEALLWQKDYGYADKTDNVVDDTDGTVAYLCFWENGTNLDWSVPELYRYSIYLETYPGQDTTGLKTITKSDGKIYYLADSYNTCDDSEPSKQTQPSLTGFKPVTYPNEVTSGYTFSTFEYQALMGTTDATLLTQPGYFDSSVYSEGYDVHFYYTRNTWELTFYNYNAESQTFTNEKKLAYEQKLSAADGLPTDDVTYTPPYPEGLEPGAYEFGGWYTSPGCYDGTEVDWTTATMPDNDLTLYAKWTPVKHNVYFYYLYTDIATKDCWDETNPDNQAIVVEHGDLLETAYNQSPARNGYRFVGWFYMDENGKKRFAPDSMEITQDLDLFAEWQSDIDTTYKVEYVLQSDATIGDKVYPAGTTIANVTEGHSTAGKTKTFSAKGGTDLYVDFRTGIFPVTGSHSILMQENSSANSYAFKYVYDDHVLYKIRYVDYETKTVLGESNPISTTNAVVTEKFLPITGYIPMPGYYYQTKALAADGDATTPIEANIITFYYMKDTDHGAYSIEYYLEDESGSEQYDNKQYRLATSIQNTANLKDDNGNATAINSGDEFEILTFDGYDYKLSVVINYNADGTEIAGVEDKELPVSGTLDANGLTIKLYYERISYPYQIQFVEYGTGTILFYGKVEDTSLYDSAAEVEAAFGSVISYTAPDEITKDGTTYEYYIPNATDEQRTGSMTIRSQGNVLKFYYTPKQYTVQYKAVCSVEGVTKFGAVSPSSQVVTTVDQLGANAAPYDGFRFEGWYTDEACTVKVNSSWVTGTEIKPKQLAETTYYALFEPVQEKLKITKSGTDLGTTDSFLFQITGEDVLGNKVNMTVAIQGAGSATIQDLYCGTYTVTELTAWSWTYSTADSSEEVTLTTKDTATEYEVTFTNAPQSVDWLHGEASKENQFAINTNTTEED